METLIDYFEYFFYNVDDLVFALLISMVTAFTCDLARELLLYGGKVDMDITVLHALAEIIGTMEATVICFEINFIIYDVFGVYVYMLSIFTNLTWQAYRPTEYKNDANPLKIIAKHLEALDEVEESQKKRRQPKENVYARFDFIMMLILAEAFGAFLAYNFLLHVAWRNAHYWRIWKETNYHAKRYSTATQWQSSMTEGPVPAAIAEGSFSCGQYLLPIYLSYRGFRRHSNILLTNAGEAVFAGVAAYYSGGYFNPIYGSALELPTHGYSTLSKVVVYWVAPITGTVLGIALGGIS